MSIEIPTFRLTGVAAIVLATSVSGAHAQSADDGCSSLLQMVGEAGENLRADFADAPQIASAADDAACTVYIQRVADSGGLIMRGDADVDVQVETAADVDSDADSADASSTQTLEIEREATIQGEVNVTLPDPQVDIEQQAAEIAVRTEQPEVSIDQPQPTITIRQAQPIIRVEMAQPTITVEQPAPEIIVTMPEPGVNVATARPQIEVNIPEPRVTVTQGEPQLNVDLDTDVGQVAERDPDIQRSDENGTMVVSKAGQSSESLEPVINFVDAEGEPTVSFNASAPQVDYQAADPDVQVSSGGEPNIEVISSGEPKIVIQEAGAQDSAAVQPLTGETGEQVAEQSTQTAAGDQRNPLEAFVADPSDAAYDGAPSASMTVEELDGLDVINGRGEDLGSVERVVRNGADTYVIVEHGGWFLGLNDKEVAFPVGNVLVRGDEMVLRGMTEEQIDAMPDYDYENEVSLEGSEVVDVMSVQ